MVSTYIFSLRSHIKSLSVLSEDAVEREKKRSLISFQMCMIGWTFELGAAIIITLKLLFKYIGLTNVYYTDSIIYFVVIPCVHLMNNEDTKAIVFGECWYQGIRHMVGIYTKPVPARDVEISNQPWKNNRNPLNSNNPIPESQKNFPSHRKIIYFRRCSSGHNLFSLAQLLDSNEVKKLQKRNSLGEASSVYLPIQYKESKII